MNMISTGAFLPETDASTKQNELVKKLTTAWEKKNSKTARAGGASLMALSLAACGGEDNTPFSAADVAAAEAAATTAALTGADGTVYASVDAAVTSNDTAIADAARAEGVASVDITSDNTEVMMSQADYDAAIAAADDDLQASYDALVASNAALQASYDALVSPTSYTLTDTDTAGVADDSVTMTAGNDVITGTNAAFDDTDIIADSSTTDNDVITITASGDVVETATVINVETVNINLEAFGAAGGAGAATTFEIEAARLGATTLNVDVTQAGSSIAAVDIDDIADGTVVNTTTDFTTVLIAADNDASYTANVGGSAATTVVTFTDNGATADDMTVNSTSALTVAATAADGDITLTSAGDMIITDADSGATVTATSTGGSVTVTTADTASTLSVTSADETTINGATGATTVTVSANGTGVAASNTTASTVTATAATTLNISGNGGALVADASASTLLSTINVTGDQDVTVQLSGANLTAARSLAMTDSSTGTSVLELNAQGTTVDLVDVAVDTIKISADMNADDIDLASGANLLINADQTATTYDGVAATATTNTVTLTVADNDGAGVTGDFATSVDFDNFAEVNFVIQDANAATSITALDAGTATVNVSGTGDVTFATSATAGSIDGSASSGDMTLTLIGAATVDTVTTGSGADTITQTTADLTTGGYTISTNAGDDSITLLAAADSTVDGGAGSDTVALDGDYRAVTLTLSNIETLDVDTDSTNTNMFVDSSLLTGATYIVTDSSNGDDDLHVNMDAYTVDLSALTIDTTTVGAIVIDGSTFGAAGGLTVTGSAAADEVTSGASADIIDTGAGNDTITDSGAGDDNITTGAGDDTVTDSGAGADTINTGAGGDTITDSGTGADIIDMGAGDDTLTDSGAGADTIDMGAGADTITDAGAGDDVITLGAGADSVDAGTGADTIDLAEATSAVDNIIYGAQGDGSAVGAAAGTLTGYDTITSFTSGTDTITASAIDTVDANVSIVAMGDASSSANDLTAADFADVDKLVSFFNDTTLGNSAFVATNAGVTVDVVAITFGTFSAVYVLDDAATDGIAAAEIEMLAHVDTVLATGDIIV